MNTIRIFLNYLISSNNLVILTSFIAILATYLLLSSDISIFSEESTVHDKKALGANSSENLKKEEEVNKAKEEEKKEKKVEMKGFQLNEIKEENKSGFILGKKTENIEHLSQKINNINNKNDEMGLMFIEGLSSLNSWKNDHLGNEIIKKTEWNLEKRENEENGLIYQYVYPNKKELINVSLIEKLKEIF